MFKQAEPERSKNKRVCFLEVSKAANEANKSALFGSGPQVFGSDPGPPGRLLLYSDPSGPAPSTTPAWSGLVALSQYSTYRSACVRLA